MNNSDQNADSGELMYVKCAYCGKWMDVKPGQMNQITHTLCKDCLEKQMKELEDLDKEGT
ncbi:MAG TPA: hypothetical protein DCZ95_19425 [Verrucomicrobia bacterium]|nr:MAG: hypothetical protein A2X46_12855 [Lentisphaerae bacterium GWF2_57_35]HBA86259.1 hypothetical protein [Verrucomicrobiota bacterium]